VSFQKICAKLRFDATACFLTHFTLLDNFPPKILSGPSELNLTVNTTVSITVTAEDPNGDPMTFNVSGSLPKGAKLATNASSVTLTWNVTTEEVTTQTEVVVKRLQTFNDGMLKMTIMFFFSFYDSNDDDDKDCAIQDSGA